MTLDLTRLFEAEGETLPFYTTLLPSDFPEVGGLPLVRPVEVNGRVYNSAGVVTAEYVASYFIDTVCDRCLAPVAKPYKLSESRVAVMSLQSEENNDYLVLPDAKLDIGALIFSDIILELPAKNLCSEDCRGLCPMCGVNLNHCDCACKPNSGDLRLSSLRDLLS